MARSSKNTLVKLLAAGCVVGLIGGVAAQDPGPDTTGTGDDPAETGTGDDETPEDPVDGGEQPDEEPEDPADAPDMPDMPEEEAEDEPEEEEEEPAADTSPDPVAADLEAIGYFAEANSDYIPGKGLALPVANVGDGGVVVANAVECAEKCEADPTCNAASYYTSEWPGGNNCWTKAIKPGCAIPADKIADDPTAWLIMSTTRCDIEVTVEPTDDMVAAPTAAAPIEAAPDAPAGMYTRYPNSDYIPADGLLVEVTDIQGSGKMVADEGECEAACDATPGCNGVSFYAEGSSVVTSSGFNCFAKIFGDTCALPPDAATDPTATLILKTCPGTTDDIPPALPAAAPTGALGGTTDTQTETGTGTGTGTGTTTRDIATPPSPPADGVTPAPSGAVSVRSAAAALAVAGAALAVF